MAPRPKRDEDALIFPKELVNQHIDPLARLLRVIYNRMAITGNIFIRNHAGAYTSRTGTTDGLTMERNNLRKRLTLDTVTWGTFRTLTEYLHRWSITEITITFRDDKTGKTHTFRSNEVIEADPNLDEFEDY